MYPTRQQIETRYWALLDDPAGSIFTDAVFQEAFGEAYDALYLAFLDYQCPRVELQIDVMVPAGTTALTPAQMGIADFGDYIFLSERQFGSNDKYIDLTSVDRLSQRPMTERLIEFNYRNDTFYFVGSTNTIDLLVKYDTSGEAPTNNNTVIAVDSSITFLANYSVGVSGGRKGYDEIAARCMSLAVGSRYDQGQIGGELFRLIQNRVRSRQHVPIANKPYSAFNRIGVRRAVPYVGVQAGTTGSSSVNTPIQFSSATGTIVGNINGVNAVFVLTIGGVLTLTVYRNGVLQTSGTDYNAINNQITFLPASIPQTGDIVTAWAYLSYN